MAHIKANERNLPNELQTRWFDAEGHGEAAPNLAVELHGDVSVRDLACNSLAAKECMERERSRDLLARMRVRTLACSSRLTRSTRTISNLPV
jgi:hypothetical protein